MSSAVSRFGPPTEALALQRERLQPIYLSKSLHIWDIIRKSCKYPNTVGSRCILVVWIGSVIGETHPLRHGDDRRQASNDDGQHVMGHDLFRDVLVSTAPLRCGTEDRPTDGLRRGFDGLHRPSSLSERTEQQSHQPLSQGVYPSWHGQGRPLSVPSSAEQGRRWWPNDLEGGLRPRATPRITYGSA
jgi:hypothetical protein